MERIQGGVEAKANLEDVLYPGWPCLSGFFLMTSSWMGSWTVLPVRYFLHDLVMGRISIMAPGTFRNVGTPVDPILKEHPELQACSGPPLWLSVSQLKLRKNMEPASSRQSPCLAPRDRIFLMENKLS